MNYLLWAPPAGVTYDADAQDYFTRAEALGGSFDLSGINPTYTAAYVKDAINDFVLGCKTDSIWTKLTEVYLLAGVTFSGVLAKLKYASVSTLTNNNFVSGDYLAAGTGCGLKGNGSTKALATEYPQPHTTDIALSAYCVEFPELGAISIFPIAGQVSSNDPQSMAIFFLGEAGPNVTFVVDLPSGTTGGCRMYYAGTEIPVYVLASSRADSDRELYVNGVSVVTNTSNGSGGTPSVADFFLFRDGSLALWYDPNRYSFMHISTGLTDTEAANLSTRVNALMTALGGNVY